MKSAKPNELSATIDGSVDRLAIVLGDQLDHEIAALQGLDKERDAVLMMEVAEEATHVPSHKQRTALFLSAMRHFASELQEKGFRVRYIRLDEPTNQQSFSSEIARAAGVLKPDSIRCTQPGEHRVRDTLGDLASSLGAEVDVVPDTRFLCATEDFEQWMEGRRSILQEHFYRWMRKRERVLLTRNGDPVGGKWNFDKDNRASFKAAPRPPKPYRPRPDGVTKEVIELVNEYFPESPGELDEGSFRWAVTRREARRSLRDFVDNRLARFGDHQDAMWTDEPLLYHAAISPSLNLGLLRPAECIEEALNAYEDGSAPLNSVEGFVRQILGWREFVRGVYWHEGPAYRERNAFRQRGALPDFYWTADTDMRCMRECISQVLKGAYGHHIQRLMVTGNFALIAGVRPQVVSDWYLGMYADGVDWVTLPNALGMVMHADGGVVGTKPYAASGRYISRMSNYCEECRYDPGERTGEGACPFTTFYWDFLIRNEKQLRKNRRMGMVLKNVERMSEGDKRDVRQRASRLRTELGVGALSGRSG